MYGPPEVITGRLMSGAGAGPMLAASAQYTAAAAAYEASADRLMAQMIYLNLVIQFKLLHFQGHAKICFKACARTCARQSRKVRAHAAFRRWTAYTP